VPLIDVMMGSSSFLMITTTTTSNTGARDQPAPADSEKQRTRERGLGPRQRRGQYVIGGARGVSLADPARR